jgi:hypothetical protein
MNNRVPMTTTVVLLFIALASVGVGYGLWSKTLYIDGTVNTGSVNSIFDKEFTDDDNVIDDPDKDLGDTGICEPPDCLYGSGSPDPAASGMNRKDKDVGQCFAELDSQDSQILNVTINNSYPSYYCTVFFDVHNTGTVPVKVQSLGLKGPAITAGYVTAEWSGLEVGQQIDPCSQNIVPGDIHIHVEQSAPQGETLELKGTIQLVQWNEYIKLAWATNGETVMDGNTVVMGQLGEAEDSHQAVDVHGGSALLPAGSSYDVTFQYHVCTWDSYGFETGPGGKGWFDSFSISTSSTPYWNLALTDPLSDGAQIDFGYLEGGNGWDDGILDCFDGDDTVNLSAFAGGTYLNAVLDTATAPANNGNFPSYGTFTVDKIVVNP